ncbi:MAG: HEPN domain-containing protein [Armatimonadetes bacterium]|nr:HEPN domain-containing protein [Armatimonadota bacterium]
MAEARLLEFEIKDAELSRYIEANLGRILQLFSPRHIIAFGSRVNGTAKEDSDIDLIVVSDVFESIPFLERSRKFNEAISWHLRVDVWCLTVMEFERLRRQVGVVADACREGIWVLQGELLPDGEVSGVMTLEEQVQMWVKQGERELDRARRLYEQDDYDGATVFAQQAAEKFLKALHIARFQATPPRTHDLQMLAMALDAPDDLVAIGRPLTEDYFRARYPDLAGAAPYEVFDKSIARERIEQAKKIRDWVRQQLGQI